MRHTNGFILIQHKIFIKLGCHKRISVSENEETKLSFLFAKFCNTFVWLLFYIHSFFFDCLECEQPSWFNCIKLVPFKYYFTELQKVYNTEKKNIEEHAFHFVCLHLFVVLRQEKHINVCQLYHEFGRK